MTDQFTRHMLSAERGIEKVEVGIPVTLREGGIPTTVRTQPGETLEQVGPNEWRVVADTPPADQDTKNETDRAEPAPVEGGGPYLIYENYEMVDGKEEPRPFTVIDGIHLAGGGYTMEAIVRIANRAYSHGFTAGQQHRSDGEEAAAKLERLMRDSDGELKISGTKHGWEIEQQVEDRMVCIGEGETFAAALADTDTPEVDDAE